MTNLELSLLSCDIGLTPSPYTQQKDLEMKKIISTEQKFFSNILKDIQRSNEGGHIKMSIVIFSISNVLAKR